jgi:hypothetical protein
VDALLKVAVIMETLIGMVGGWQLAVGSWRLAVGSWQLAEDALRLTLYACLPAGRLYA